METFNLRDVVKYVEENIDTFHQKRIAGLQDLKLKRVLSKKNPYLFKANYVLRHKTLSRVLQMLSFLHKKKQYLAIGLKALLFSSMIKFIMAENQEQQA